MRTVSFVADNQLRLLECGAEFFPALINALDVASAEIHLETYIFADDAIGASVKAALIRAASRGVMVYVVTDWIGTGRAQSGLLDAEFRAAGVHHRSFNPWFRRGLARTHRKMCVVDRSLAFIGGLNINDDMISDDDSRSVLPEPRWDFAVEIRGPLVAAMHRETEAQWLRLGSLKIKVRWELFRETRILSRAGRVGSALAGLVIRDNLRNRRTIQRATLRALGGAHKSAVLTTPYFAPGRKMREALSQAALRGIDVTLLLGVGQFRMQDAVAHSFYPKLLESGVKVVEFRRTQLHAKAAVIDDDWATVGSSNYDGLSLFLNQEANVVIKDAAFATTLRGHLERAIAASALIAPEAFAGIGRLERIWYGMAYFLYRNALRLATFGRYS
ncbi:phospholipase D-like domain-containing protein [Actimicrobium antarcticum]|uniref:Cardiolipin synthase ClsB n=1 Tax=Actimicrobium antarcticum TaxID=1051899 RepID=A0ABP7TA63_9BURK